MSDSESPLDRATKAVAERYSAIQDEHLPQSVATLIAVAVLEAIREPSEAMLAAAPEIDGIKSDAEALAFWESMLDAALQD